MAFTMVGLFGVYMLSLDFLASPRFWAYFFWILW